MSLLRLDVERHVLAEGGDDPGKQLGIGIGLEQHDMRQATDHHPLAERDREAVVVVDVRVGGEEPCRIGVGLGRLVGDPPDLLGAHAAGADEGDQFVQGLFHGEFQGR